MRKVSIILAACVLVILAALAVAPRLVDWRSYRGAIAGELDAATGLTLRIDGPIGFVLLPTPRLRLADIVVQASPAAGAPVLLRARALDLRLTLGRLLTGRVAARDVVLVDPVATMEHLAEARPAQRLAWLFEPPGRAGIVRLSIVGGRIVYGPDRIEAALTHVTLDLVRTPASGALRLDGSFIRDGNAFSLTASSAGGTTALPVELDLAALGSGAKLGLTGTLSPSGDGLALGGRLSLAGPSLAAAASELTGRTTVLPATAFALSGRLGATSGAAGRLRLDRITLSSGALHASGEASVDLTQSPSFAVSLAIPELDLDRLDLGRVGLSPALLAAALARRPGAWQGRIVAHIDAVTWHGRLARRLQATASVAHGEVVATLGALLPGGGHAQVSATVSAGRMPHATPQATGTITLGADDLRALLRAGGLEPRDIAADHLRRAVLSTRFRIGTDRIALDHIALDLDATHVTGQAAVTLGRRPAIAARLAADTIDLAGYLPRDWGPRRLARRAGEALRAADLDLDATIGTIVVGGRPLQDVHLAARAQDGRITIADARIGGIGGATAHLSGTLDDLADAPPHLSLHIALAGPTLAAVLLPAARGRLADALAGPFSLAGTIASARGTAPGVAGSGALDTSLHVTFLGGSGTLAGTLSLSPAPQIAGHLAFAVPSYARLLDEFALGTAAETGPVTLAADFTGDAAGLRLDKLAMGLGTQTLAGDARLNFAGTPRVTAALRGGTIALAPLVPQGGLGLAALPGVAADLSLAAAQASWDAWRFAEPHLHITTSGARLQAQATASGFLGGRLAGSLAVTAGTPPHVGLTLHLADTDLARLATDDAGQPIATGKATADLSAQADGDGMAELTGTLAGTASLTTDAGSLTGIDLKALAQAVAAPARASLLRRALQGDTAFTRLATTCRIASGVARCPNLAVALAGGAAKGSLVVDLPGGQLSGGAEIRLDAPSSAPPIMMLLSGPIAAPHRGFDLTPLEAYAKARPPQTP